MFPTISFYTRSNSRHLLASFPNVFNMPYSVKYSIYSLHIKLYRTAFKCTYKQVVMCGYTYFLIHNVKCKMQEIEVKGFCMQTYAPDSGTHWCMLTCMHINMYVSCTYHTKVIRNDMYEFTY
jgi:hypothetical protein